MLLGKCDIIDPVGVCLSLGTKPRNGSWAAVGLGGVNDGGVATRVGGIVIQVPGADYAISATRISMSELGRGPGRWKDQGRVEGS